MVHAKTVSDTYWLAAVRQMTSCRLTSYCNTPQFLCETCCSCERCMVEVRSAASRRCHNNTSSVLCLSRLWRTHHARRLEHISCIPHLQNIHSFPTICSTSHLSDRKKTQPRAYLIVFTLMTVHENANPGCEITGFPRHPKMVLEWSPIALIFSEMSWLLERGIDHW